MRTSIPTPDDVFSVGEVARAAGVSGRTARHLVRDAQIPAFRGYLDREDALRAVRMLRGIEQAGHGRSPLTLPRETRRRSGFSLVASGLLHAAAILALVFAAWLKLLDANDTEQIVKDASPVRLVFLMTPGPGGGGGGSGLKMPEPPSRAERKPPARVVRKVSSPVPPVRKSPTPRPVTVEPPRPLPPPNVDPVVADPPKPAPAPPAVQAPVVPAPADSKNTLGVLSQAPALSVSAGSGQGGSAGAGDGSGLGDGRGAGIGPGSGGGTGGGPFQPGAGIEPPTLLREVKPLYTDEARRRSIEGDVTLEIVVRRDGSVGSPRVTRSLGAGLDERAVDAVRQWRFGPARRQGAPVDVVVEVSVEFKLR